MTLEMGTGRSRAGRVFSRRTTTGRNTAVTHAVPSGKLTGLSHASSNGHSPAEPESIVTQSSPTFTIAEVGPAAQRIVANIEHVIAGKYDVIRLGVTVLLAEGHLLIEDVPGVGKTTFAKPSLVPSTARSAAIHALTPDLLPAM